MSFDLQTLNSEQIKPVMDTEGAVLVTAGAGSGKTRLLTHRIAHIIRDLNVPPYNILAITFTNKAANEMRERLNRMLEEDASSIWVFTFHSLCVRILRKFIANLGGYTSNFSIYDETDKERCIKRVLAEIAQKTGGSDANSSKKDKDDELQKMTKKIIFCISDAKNQGLTPSEYASINASQDDIDLIAEVYDKYEKELKNCNSLDFDDLLNKAYYLLKNDKEAREYYQEKFRYIHVDEFQDTNTVQYNIVKILAARHRNIFIVGDEDQSIYGWRGADFANIFNFTKDYDAKVYKLEQNYRSTKKIIELANRIIKNNTTRLDKLLWTDNAMGDEVAFYPAKSDNEEADYVVRKIIEVKRQNGCKYSDFAILMRINSLTRNFEERLMQYGIPHKIFGGFKFYDRKEIKDLLAYFKVIVNHADVESLMRIINFPRRGIGDATVTQLKNYASLYGYTLYDVIFDIEKNVEMPSSVIKKVAPFSVVLHCLQNAYAQNPPIYDLMYYIIKLIGLNELYAEDNAENNARKENIRELLHGIAQFQQLNPEAGLDEYLQQVSLYTDLEEMSDADDCVTLATVHSSKGLEFTNVFVIGLEDGIFPSGNRCESDSELEEERRLMYVAVTRAKKRLFLTMAASRYRFGARQDCMPSQFLREAGFAPKRVSAYEGYSGRYDSYRGKSYASYGDKYNPEQVPDYAPSTPVKSSFDTGKQKVDLSKYKPGVKVMHKKFGVGRLISVDTSGEPYAVVEFGGKGRVNLLLGYAPMQILD